MKNLLVLIFLSFLFTGCEQVTTAIDNIINYFVDIEPSTTTGTENTEFVFKANTNDIVDHWVIDGAIIPDENELSYTFSSGSHTISVVTQNGAEDEVIIEVSPLETIFKLSATFQEITTELYLDFPLLIIDGTEYNIETTDSLNISETETQRIISLSIEADNQDSFIFINNNAWEIHALDLDNLSIMDMNKLIYLLFPERYETEPDFDTIKYNLSGVSSETPDILYVFPDHITLNGETIENTDLAAVYTGNVKKYMIDISIDNSDSFLFINGNMYNFFGIDFSDMSYGEFVIAADILNRYPEEGILELMEVY
jgi:hypothetical protein